MQTKHLKVCSRCRIPTWTFGICFVINNLLETLQRALRMNLTENAGVFKLSDLMTWDPSSVFIKLHLQRHRFGDKLCSLIRQFSGAVIRLVTDLNTGPI